MRSGVELSRYKMYKKGKQWLFAATAFSMFLIGGSFIEVHADSNNNQTNNAVLKEPSSSNTENADKKMQVPRLIMLK
ncbi:KxYKxGKxW signal peptide domain-containing protein [Pediococcus argentinicus]|nr:KxYKxGKxW signal peptide domain-containing protein [Pediococcus argentinicus]NKZ22193.1 KxYKxGKxW signal peptide domain-containing protein [Pediococcus argentinicus]GEP19242.1 hypothetical protein LSA03_06260 [Pediococcus argentinicus]